MDLRGGTGSGCSPDAPKTLTGFEQLGPVSEEKVELRVSLEDAASLTRPGCPGHVRKDKRGT